MAARQIRTVILCPGRSRPHEKCPKCGSYMVEKGNKLLCANETCGYRMDKPAEEQK